jgi:hypothetical protein
MMNKLILSVVIGIFFGLTISAQTVNATPETTIKNFYSWYVKQLVNDKFPLTDQPTKLKQFITVRCYKENKKDYDNDRFDADYFISAQDFDEKWATNIKISNVRINGGRATANVVLDGEGDFDSKLKLKLIKEKSIWKIDVIDVQ